MRKKHLKDARQIAREEGDSDTTYNETHRRLKRVLLGFEKVDGTPVIGVLPTDPGIRPVVAEVATSTLELDPDSERGIYVAEKKLVKAARRAEKAPKPRKRKTKGMFGRRGLPARDKALRSFSEGQGL